MTKHTVEEGRERRIVRLEERGKKEDEEDD